MSDKPITPENLEQAGFILGYSSEYSKWYECGDVLEVVFRLKSERVEVRANCEAVPYATTMAHIEQLKELLLGIKPKPEPITQQALLDNGFAKSLGGGYCFEGEFYSIVVYFYNFHDAPMEIILCGEGESVRFRYKQLEKMMLEDLLALKRIVEY